MFDSQILRFKQRTIHMKIVEYIAYSFKHGRSRYRALRASALLLRGPHFKEALNLREIHKFKSYV